MFGNSAQAHMFRIRVTEEGQSERLDRYVTVRMPDTSRAFVQRLIEQGAVTVNGASARPSYKLAAGDEIVVQAPTPNAGRALEPAEIPVPIVYEDDDILVFD